MPADFPDPRRVHRVPVQVLTQVLAHEDGLNEQSDEVLTSPVSTRPSTPRGSASQRAFSPKARDEEGTIRRMIARLASTPTKSAVRLLAYILSKLWRRIFARFTVDETHIAVIVEAAKRGPVIFVPTHKSHLDYLVVSYIAFVYGLPIPHIAAGENLIDFSFILRPAGAFFIRRSFRDDPLYRRVFKSYIHTLLHEQLSLEFFIEGGRSRSGALLPPKLGLLGAILDFHSAPLAQFAPYSPSVSASQITVVPVAITYEDLFGEARGLAHEFFNFPLSLPTVLTNEADARQTRRNSNDRETSTVRASSSWWSWIRTKISSFVSAAGKAVGRATEALSTGVLSATARNNGVTLDG
jgi:1-acyl-sn-glycerol-3-phosphate acyltransferase